MYVTVGGRKIEHLHDNIQALRINLTDAHMQTLESVLPFDIGFPAKQFGADPALAGETTNGVLKASAPMQWVREVRAIEAVVVENEGSEGQDK